MGYVEKLMGDNERMLYRTHRHFIVLLQQIVGWFFAFAVFLACALVALWPRDPEKAAEIRWWIGLIALVSVVMPLVLIVSAWLQGYRGRDLLGRIWLPIVACVLILFVALLTMFRPDLPYVGWVALLLAAVALVELIRGVLDWVNERYIITNRRIVQVRGIINKEVSDSALEKVNDVVLQQSMFGRMLGYGTVEIITGSDIGVNLFKRIANPVRFKRAMLNAKEQLHATVPAIEAEEAAPYATQTLHEAQPPAKAADEGLQTTGEVPPAADAIPELIADLDELRQKGILSEEEFQAKKTDLLSRL